MSSSFKNPQRYLFVPLPFKLLKGVTIASGGVLPNIHPELLAKKRGSKGKLEAIITPPPAKKAKSPSQKKTTTKKASAKKVARKSKVHLIFFGPIIQSYAFLLRNN